MVSEVQMEPMTIADYDEVRALWMTISGFGIRTLDDSREDIERFIRRNPTTSVVAKVDGHIVGSILCGMRELSRMGINKVSLIAFRRNDVGNAFWRNIGWTQADANYYEFVLNENNITQFIGDENGNT